jgi:hypothetical protein
MLAAKQSFARMPKDAAADVNPERLTYICQNIYDVSACARVQYAIRVFVLV